MDDSNNEEGFLIIYQNFMKPALNSLLWLYVSVAKYKNLHCFVLVVKVFEANECSCVVFS